MWGENHPRNGETSALGICIVIGLLCVEESFGGGGESDRIGYTREARKNLLTCLE